MATTDVDELIDTFNHLENENDSNVDNLPKIVSDLSHSIDKRVNALEQYYAQNGNNAIEIIRTLASMYQMSGSKLIEHFFYTICSKALISPFLKVEAAKCLLDYEEINRSENNDNRKLLGYNALDHVCCNLSEMPTPCRIEAIFILMKSEKHRTNADFYFKEFIRTDSLECDYRYSTILSLENIGSDEMKQELYEYSCKEEILDNFFGLLRKWMLPHMKKTKRNCRYILSKLSYEEVKNLYMNIFPERECGRDWFIKSAQLEFFFYHKIPVYYRIISGQYLLKISNMLNKHRDTVEKQMIYFAESEDIEYNLRADAADILITFGSEVGIDKGKEIIMQLGRINGPVRTIFDNAQNLHTEKVEESVSETLEYLSTLPINNNRIDFDYVNSHVEKMLKEELESVQKVNVDTEIICKYHVNSTHDNFCSEVCKELYDKNEKIIVAMKRIFIDRALYSKFNISLVNILLKIYNYIQIQEDESIKLELYKRMLQELEEMSGTCSSGFASRLVNVISGYGNFNIRISFEDQIISNFSGRLNAAARAITCTNSVFRLDKIEDVVELCLLEDDKNDLRTNIELKLNSEESVEKKPNPSSGEGVQLSASDFQRAKLEARSTKIRDIVVYFLSENREEKIEECIQYFAESVFNEMAIKSSMYSKRRFFGLFFRTYVSKIREELAIEFKEFVSETDFDLFFRKAIMMYEGEF